MSSILVVDDMAIFRDPIAASLKLAGYTTYCAKDGVTGLAELRAHHPDLVLLDVSMPVLDGMSFIRAMRREPAVANTPIILLTALADKKFMIEAAKLGVQDYLLKSRFSLKELNERIKRLLSAKKAPVAAAVPGKITATQKPDAQKPDAQKPDQQKPEQQKPGAVGTATLSTAGNHRPQLEPYIPEDIAPLMNSQQCVSRVEDCMSGKTLSGAVAEVLMLASRPSAELKDLTALITRDPVLSVRVLQMANSAAFFSRRGAVTTINEAVKNIGANNVRNIAASVGIFDAMPASSSDGFNPIRCWQHSFAVARLCEAFVAPTAPDEAGVAYLVGLCHDLGEIMFRTQFEQEYKSVLEQQVRTGASLDDIERRLLGMTHNDILKVILKCMGLPETIRNPIERFQRIGRNTGEQPIVSRALAMADNYANGLLLVSSESSLISPIIEKDWLALSGPTRLAAPDGEEIRSQVYCLTAILSRMNSSDQAALIKSPYKKSKAAVWVARDPAFSGADPFAEALGVLATIEVHDHLPSPAELKNFTALAVEGRGVNVPGWSWAEITKCGFSTQGIPLLWLINTDSATPGDQPVSPVREVSIRDIQSFVGQTTSSELRAAA